MLQWVSNLISRTKRENSIQADYTMGNNELFRIMFHISKLKDEISRCKILTTEITKILHPQ